MHILAKSQRFLGALFIFFYAFAVLIVRLTTALSSYKRQFHNIIFTIADLLKKCRQNISDAKIIVF
jgi:hypothetical protein